MKNRYVVGCILFFAAFLIYLHGAYPSVSAGDSGEFITAAHTLGIPHAPGYPTYTLLATVVDRILPWGNHGYRVNLFSALCAASAVLLMYVLGLQLFWSLEISAFGAILLMVLPAFQANAQASEVFALHTAFCLGVVCVALANHWMLAAFLTGLGLGNHQTVLFLVPALGIAYLARRSGGRTSWLAIFLAALAGLSVYLFLLIRAAQEPVLNGGHPDTLERLWRVLTRADYGSLTLALGDTPARTPENTIQQMVRFFQGLADEITWVGVAGGFVATLFWIRKQFVPAYMLLVAFLFLGPIFFLLGNLPFDAQSNGLLQRFYMVPACYAIVLLSGGIELLGKRVRWSSFVVFALPIFIAFTQSHATVFRQDVRAWAYGRNNLRTLPHKAHFIMDGGDDTFYTLAYLTRVEKRRPDISLHDRGGVVFPGVYGPDFRRLTRSEKEPRRQQVEEALLATGKPLFYSTMNLQILPGHRQIQSGLLYWTTNLTDTFTPLGHLWAIYDLRGVPPWDAPSHIASPDYRTRALIPFYAFQRSVETARSKQWESTIAFASSAHEAGPDVVWLGPNLMHNGYVWAQENFDAGRLDIAEKIYRAMTQWDPHAALAWTNLGAIEEKQQHLDLAIAHYQTAIKLDPSSESAHYNLAVAYWKRSEWPRVIEELTRVLSINPANQAARQYLDQAQARALTTPSR